MPVVEGAQPVNQTAQLFHASSISDPIAVFNRAQKLFWQHSWFGCNYVSSVFNWIQAEVAVSRTETYRLAPFTVYKDGQSFRFQKGEKNKL